MLRFSMLDNSDVNCLLLSNNNSGGSRISQRRGANILFGQKFPENCMKSKEFGPRGGGERPWRSTLRSANEQ